MELQLAQLTVNESGNYVVFASDVGIPPQGPWPTEVKVMNGTTKLFQSCTWRDLMGPGNFDGRRFSDADSRTCTIFNT